MNIEDIKNNIRLNNENIDKIYPKISENDYENEIQVDFYYLNDYFINIEKVRNIFNIITTHEDFYSNGYNIKCENNNNFLKIYIQTKNGKGEKENLIQKLLDEVFFNNIKKILKISFLFSIYQEYILYCVANAKEIPILSKNKEYKKLKKINLNLYSKKENLKEFESLVLGFVLHMKSLIDDLKDENILKYLSHLNNSL